MLIKRNRASLEYTRVAKKFCNIFYTSAKINRKCLQCGVFRLLLQRRGTIRFLAHAQGIVKMAWCGDCAGEEANNKHS
jgi:hypothetical protein